MASSSSSSMCNNIIQNHDFSKGMNPWYTNCCDCTVCDRYAVVSNRKECWQGLEQDITTRVSPGVTYTLCARVGVSGTHHPTHVIATLRLEYHASETKYMFITRTSVSEGRWENLEGTFVLSDKPYPDRVVFYLEGPEPGVNLLVQHVLISCPISVGGTGGYVVRGKDENIVLNPDMEEGVNKWSGRGCRIGVHKSMGDGKILPKSGNFFASATQRTQTWNGIQQDITSRVERKLAYNVIATVRIFGNNTTSHSADVKATLWVQTPDSREQYISIANTQATDKEWVDLQGTFVLNGYLSKVVIYLEGPPPGIDILLNGLVVKRANKIPPSPRPLIQNVEFGVNILANSDLRSGTNGWFPLGNCALSVAASGSPPAARGVLGAHQQPLSGHSIHATNRTHTWMGPAQLITDKVKLFVTYQVSAWVRLVPGATGSPQNVSVALGVDDQWLNAGQVEVNDDSWHEICGSFRIEKPAGKVMVYVQGPAPGICFMVSRFQIFAVDRQARFRQLKHQTDKIRKRDIILKFATSNSRSMHGATVKIKQIHNSFPIGSCISRTNIDNEDFVAFFLKHFNWAVFGNELKWYWTESQRGKFNYRDADELFKFCADNNIDVRGHCIFWEVEDTVQDWVKSLGRNDLAVAVQNRLNGLLKRYKGKVRHYDVNNEMLHGSFYQDRLGKDNRANMFKEAKRLDSSAVLFVNDYHVEDGCDPRSSPERYIDQILHLQEQGAPVEGIGIQGHIDSPVGSIVCSALDKLAITGLPIWFTELDVCSSNEHVRADDLEVMMREAFAHPSVEGIMLWGFWESFMSRENGHLVDAEGEVNEAGKRFIELKKEWLSDADGYIDERNEFSFRGFEGTYQVEIQNHIVKTFVVHKKQQQQVVAVYVD
ncbi:hypothetical protein M8C21_010478 [Ambrosia artemisiifolia]|uniref:GH10 domain-containing protein n=1 Tax=Ambrosia artemisiifolia TaxID=4212 RepID=A0AAD5CPQ0_AMBAR|nr:hypothetical protein M8C21_010478 [Ambrosia artemisiifolia]